METIQLLPIMLLFFAIEIIYFKIAEKYHIVDKPNERSSHTELTIRGGGIIFIFAALIAVAFHPEYWLPVLGLVIIGVLSFVDDQVNLSSIVRLLFHLCAVTILFVALGLFSTITWWIIIGLYIIIIGIINAYNFMDGINGITGAYSLIILSALQYVNYNIHKFIPVNFIWMPILATIVFLYFNFRTKAKCFAGDVGSITIAFWIIYLLLKLMLLSGNYAYILFLSVYGVDTILTIIHRLFLRQNIFEGHRLHFYQILANEQQWPQLVVSSMYALVQLGIIVAVVFSSWTFLPLFLATVVPLTIIYIWLKLRMMTKAGL